MKLAKLSLAAVIAVGAFSTANAANLEEAIKDVTISGFMRYRYYNDDVNQGTAQGAERHRFSNAFTFISPVAENLTAGFTVSVERSEYAANAANGTDDVTASKMWFKYATKAYSVRVGKQEINTPWTEPGYGGSKGTGAVAMYTGIEGVTLAAAAFASTSGVDLGTATGENLYAAAVIGSVANVNYQVWYATMTNQIDSSIFAQLDTKVAGFALKGQMVNLEVANGDDGTFYGVEGGYAMDGFGLTVGYTKTDDDQPIYTLDADDAGTLKYGQQIYADTYNQADADTVAVIANAKVGKIGLEAGFVDVEIANADRDETYGKVSYKYSKNFAMSAYYSAYDTGSAATENDEFRFEAKYSF